ncbi:AAA family ATPase [Sphingobacterium detergens]|uniref:AAA family ATPase n=1 Tax=Sphingobacterium detergens TaxID=1145106 RepID=UPI003AB0A7F7
MVIVRLKKLRFQQFKGIENLEIDFSPRVTNIYGANGTCKSTIFDGFNFLLFDKNASGETRFSKKPLDKDGNTSNKVSNVVYGEFDVNDRLTTMEHVHSEKWSNSDGEERFNGNENTYKYNDVPTKPTEYKKMVSEIMSEETFKMITNPEYFASLPPDVRRKHIESICGTMTDEQVAKSHEKFNELIADINKVTINGLKIKLVAQRTKIRQEIKDLPKLIQEAIRDLPEEGSLEGLKSEITLLEKKYSQYEQQLLDINAAENLKNDEAKKLLNEIHELELANQKIFNTHKSEYELELHDSRKDYDSIVKQLADLSLKLTKIEEEISKAENTPDRIVFLKTQLVNSEKDIELLVTEFDKKNAEEFKVDEDSFICKYCGELPSDPNKVKEKREDLRTEFYIAKNASLDSIEAKGLSLSKIIEGLKLDIANAEEKHLSYKKELATERDTLQEQKLDIESRLVEMDEPSALSLSIKTTEARVSNDAVYLKNAQKVRELRSQENNTPAEKPKEFTEIITKKGLLNAEIDSLKRKEFSLIERQKKLDRKDELTTNGKVLGAAVAELERKISLIGNFEQTKAQMIEDKVAEHFKYVRFKFFEFTLEGDVNPICEILLDGVPYSDLNSAKKLNAGLDIINTLSKHFGVSAPVFLDNRESVTDIIETDAQIINLIVSPGDSKLRVELN